MANFCVYIDIVIDPHPFSTLYPIGEICFSSELADVVPCRVVGHTHPHVVDEHCYCLYIKHTQSILPNICVQTCRLVALAVSIKLVVSCIPFTCADLAFRRVHIAVNALMYSTGLPSSPGDKLLPISPM